MQCSFAVVSQTVSLPHEVVSAEDGKGIKVFGAVQGFRHPLGVLECPRWIREAAVLVVNIKVQSIVLMLYSTVGWLWSSHSTLLFIFYKELEKRVLRFLTKRSDKYLRTWKCSLPDVAITHLYVYLVITRYPMKTQRDERSHGVEWKGRQEWKVTEW